MTTRDELIEGLRMIAREGLRTTAGYGADDWAYQVHDEGGGWTVKQVYCHLTSTAEVLPGLAGALANAEEGQNAAASIDIDSFNAQGVAAREKLEESALLEAFSGAYDKAIEAVQALPEEQLQLRRRFGAIEAPVADLIETFVVLHGLSHVYHAQSRPLN